MSNTQFAEALAWVKNLTSGKPTTELPSSPRLDSIASIFALSEFERAVLILSACLEIDSSAMSTRLTVGYALEKLPNPHWDAFSPSNPLRRWNLIHLDQNTSLAQAPIRLDESVLLAILGANGLDEPLLRYIRPVESEAFSNKRIANVSQQAATTWETKSPAINLIGSSTEPKTWVFMAAAQQLGMTPWQIESSLIPTTAEGQFELATHWTRYAAIHGATLQIDAHEEAVHAKAFAAQLKTPYAICSAERVEIKGVVHLEVAPASSEERTEYWRTAIGDDAQLLNGKLREIVDQFDVSPSRLAEIVENSRKNKDNFEDSLWSEAKSASRRKLDELAQRIDPVATWDDLVLPEEQKHVLRELVAQVRKRAVVHHDWGFGDRIARGLGIAALFHGASGTGKTLSAEVLANELGLDLFRIDLSSVVSKYIGDTEKNLKKLFDAAERCGAVLLFDEADALFGKRTEVKDSHDRYANIEVGYLLQRMESYRGIAILTTNMKDSFDPAFLRRLRFIVGFPFPGPAERKEIWRKCIPAKAPLANIDFDKLARLNISGGHIRNIALSAAFLAADESSKIKMSHFRMAAKTEYSKLDRPLLESEVAEWA